MILITGQYTSSLLFKVSEGWLMRHIHTSEYVMDDGHFHIFAKANRLFSAVQKRCEIKSIEPQTNLRLNPSETKPRTVR